MGTNEWKEMRIIVYSLMAIRMCRAKTRLEVLFISIQWGNTRPECKDAGVKDILESR